MDYVVHNYTDKKKAFLFNVYISAAKYTYNVIWQTATYFHMDVITRVFFSLMCKKQRLNEIQFTCSWKFAVR